MKRLYVCEWSPNGTNDILVVQDNEIIAVHTEALFGVRVEREPMEKQVYAIEDFIGTATDAEAEDFGLQLVREISSAEALRRVAVSPVSDGSAAEVFIRSFFGGVE